MVHNRLLHCRLSLLSFCPRICIDSLFTAKICKSSLQALVIGGAFLGVALWIFFANECFRGARVRLNPEFFFRECFMLVNRRLPEPLGTIAHSYLDFKGSRYSRIRVREKSRLVLGCRREAGRFQGAVMEEWNICIKADKSRSLCPIIHSVRLTPDRPRFIQIAYSARAKLYLFKKDEKSWSDMGTGVLRLMKNTATDLRRVVLRNDMGKVSSDIIMACRILSAPGA